MIMKEVMAAGDQEIMAGKKAVLPVHSKHEIFFLLSRIENVPHQCDEYVL